MKLFSYIKYFFYICFNWDIRIATRILAGEIRGEKKYGINTTGADELKGLEEKGIDITHATIYMPASYELLEEIFIQLNRSAGKPTRHFLDLGCGKGRALCVAAHAGFNKVTGIDLSKELCEQAKENCSITKKMVPSLEFLIINNDAFYFVIPDDVDCIFMFNPFDEIIMSGVLENILISLQQAPRKLAIAYVNPLHKSIFIKAGFSETYYYRKMKYLEVSVLSN